MFLFVAFLRLTALRSILAPTQSVCWQP